MNKSYKGFIDSCTQNEMSGWSTAPFMDVYVNGELVGKIESGETRSDLVAAGIGDGRAFYFRFPFSLWINDRVAIRLPGDELVIPGEQNSHLPRLKMLLSPLDLTRPGLELGPLNRPIIPQCYVKVAYIDHVDHKGLKSKYARSFGKEAERIVPVDYIWKDGLTLYEVVGKRSFSWVIASHVGEHVADFVGWLNHLWSVLEVGGAASLALPHGDRTFDACRPKSSFEDLVGAHIMGHTRPSADQVLRHMLGVSDYWNINLRSADNLDGLKEAVNTAKAAQSGSYIDVHCHVFTPESFIECFTLLEACGLVRLKLKTVTDAHQDEFFVHLEKC